MNRPIAGLAIVLVSACGTSLARTSSRSHEDIARDSSQFAITLPPDFILRHEDGIDSWTRLWSNGTDSVSTDWGSSGIVASLPLRPPEGSAAWTVRDTILGGSAVQIATYELKGRYMLEALWPALGIHEFAPVRFKAVLWLIAETRSLAARNRIQESLATIVFK